MKMRSLVENRNCCPSQFGRLSWMKLLPNRSAPRKRFSIALLGVPFRVVTRSAGLAIILLLLIFISNSEPLLGGDLGGVNNGARMITSAGFMVTSEGFIAFT